MRGWTPDPNVREVRGSTPNVPMLLFFLFFFPLFFLFTHFNSFSFHFIFTTYFICYPTFYKYTLNIFHPYILFTLSFILFWPLTWLFTLGCWQLLMKSIGYGFGFLGLIKPTILQTYQWIIKGSFMILWGVDMLPLFNHILVHLMHKWNLTCDPILLIHLIVLFPYDH